MKYLGFLLLFISPLYGQISDDFPMVILQKIQLGLENVNTLKLLPKKNYA